MVDGEREVCTHRPASEGSSLSPPFFLRLLLLAPLAFSSSDIGSQPGTYFFPEDFSSGSSFPDGFFAGFFFSGGISGISPREIVGTEVAKLYCRQ